MPSWLYKVAYRVACQARRRDLTNRMAVLAKVAAKSEADGAELRGVLDEEIAGLAEVYRRALVLCCLQGRTVDEAARLLGCPRGTMATRLGRAKEQLRRRLTRRGWAVSTATVAVVLGDKALAVPLPAGLLASTLAYVSGTSANAGALSAKVLALSDGVLRMLWLNKMKMAAGVVLALVLVGTGVGLVVRQTWAGGGAGQAGKAEPAAEGQNANGKADAQDGTRVEIAGTMRKEVAKLRDELLKEIKDLRVSLRQDTAPRESGPLYRDKPASFWLHKFKDADPKYRAEAMEALGHLAQRNKELIPVVMTGLKDDDDRVIQVRHVSPALSRFLPGEVVPGLLEVFKDKSSPSGRCNVVMYLQAAWT